MKFSEMSWKEKKFKGWKIKQKSYIKRWHQHFDSSVELHYVDISILSINKDFHIYIYIYTHRQKERQRLG